MGDRADSFRYLSICEVCILGLGWLDRSFFVLGSLNKEALKKCPASCPGRAVKSQMLHIQRGKIPGLARTGVIDANGWRNLLCGYDRQRRRGQRGVACCRGRDGDDAVAVYHGCDQAAVKQQSQGVELVCAIGAVQ